MKNKCVPWLIFLTQAVLLYIQIKSDNPMIFVPIIMLVIVIINYNTEIEQINFRLRQLKSLQDKSREYDRKRENGLIINAPFPIGTSIFKIIRGKIEKYKVYGFSVDRDGAWLAYLHYEYNDKTYETSIEIKDIGKKGFLTREEAEDFLESKRK